MLNKNNSKILLIILVVLVALFIVLKYSDHSDSTIVSDLVTVDTAQIDQIVIHPPKAAPAITLQKEKNQWKVIEGKEQHVADKRKIRGILADMLALKPISVAATSKTQWKKYELTDSLATRVQLMQGDKVKSDILLGKFNYIPSKNRQRNPYQRRPQGEMISYVRPYADANSYVVDGMIKMNFSANADSYRDKTLLKMDQASIQKIDFTAPGSAPFSLVKKNKYWEINHEPVDSATVVRYLRYLSHTSGSKIIDHFNTKNNPQVGKITIERENSKPVELTAFVADSALTVLHSSLNNDTYFDGTSGKLFNRFFVNKNWFFKKAKKTKKRK